MADTVENTEPSTFDIGRCRRDVEAMLAAKDFMSAAGLLREAAAQLPRDINIRIGLVSALYSAREVAEARAESLGLEGCSTDEANWQKLYKLFYSVKDFSRAERATVQFLQVCPQHEVASLRLIEHFYEMGREAEALEAGDAMLARSGISLEAVYKIVQVQIRSKKWDRAMETATRTLDAGVDHFGLRLSLAQVFHLKNMKRDVGRQIRALEAFAFEKQDRWADVAEVAIWAGQRRRASTAVSLALKYPALSWGRRLQVAQILSSLNRKREAVSMIMSITVEDITDPRLIEKVVRVTLEVMHAWPDTAEAYDFALRSVNALGERVSWTTELMEKRHRLSHEKIQFTALDAGRSTEPRIFTRLVDTFYSLKSLF